MIVLSRVRRFKTRFKWEGDDKQKCYQKTLWTMGVLIKIFRLLTEYPSKNAYPYDDC
jgi:hypothetical protein